MSACEHAEEISEAYVYDDTDGTPIEFECQCGAGGNIASLLGCNLKDECDSTLWCPRCKTSAWMYK